MEKIKNEIASKLNELGGVLGDKLNEIQNIMIQQQKQISFLRELLVPRQMPQIADIWESAEILASNSKSFIRFGDGEFYLWLNGHIPFQKTEPKLSEILRQIALDSSKNLDLGLSRSYFYYEEKRSKITQEFLKEFLPNFYAYIHNFLQIDRKYLSANLVPYTSFYNTNFDYEKYYKILRKIWEKREICVVCGDRVFDKIKYNIFSNAKKIHYIYGPTLHAFSEYERLSCEILSQSKDQLLCFVLGPCGKALAYLAFKNGFRALDLGHLIKDYDAYKNGYDMSGNAVFEFYKPD